MANKSENLKLLYKPLGAFKYYVIRLGGVGGLNQNDDNDDAFRGGGGSGT